MTDLIAFPPGRPAWLGKWTSQYTPADLEASAAFDRYLLRMHQQGWTHAELASRHQAGVTAIWKRVQAARDIERQVARELEGKRDVERVLREMVASQQVRLAEQEAQIAELAMQTRRVQKAEKTVAALGVENRRLQKQVSSLLSAARTELAVAS